MTRAGQAVPFVPFAENVTPLHPEIGKETP